MQRGLRWFVKRRFGGYFIHALFVRFSHGEEHHFEYVLGVVCFGFGFDFGFVGGTGTGMPEFFGMMG